jgi:DNA-binding beta-propeller fold protein YncE
VEYDLEQERVLRVVDLPISEEARTTPREQYLLDSAHHGIAMNPAGTKLCVAGTMSDYAAIDSRSTFQATVFPVGEKPYWSTNGLGGGTCWVSFSGDDRVGVFDYGAEQQVATIPVGDHPQRVRPGAVQTAYLAGLPQR